MKTIEIDDGTYELVLKMARLTDETMEYILYRSVTREYVQGDEYHKNVTKYWMERNSGITIKCKKEELPNKINPEYICHCDWIEVNFPPLKQVACN